ncbi:MAG: MmgE/PrpD family protein [Rhizobiales bacterium]|nr:MmgE/PrpD family protein [Hyphomicrobiales bacterium]
MSFTADLASWAAGADGRHRPAAARIAGAAIIDIVSCMVAGAGDEATKAVAAGVGAAGRGACLAFAGPRLTPALAALVNGTAAHALDFDDNFAPGLTHATAVLVPALLALAEEEGLSGAAIVDAYCIGLELQARIGRLMLPRHYELGWHATSTIGAIGTAGACARLLKLDAAAILAAMSIASSMAGGSKKQFGSMVKPLHAGIAAHHAVLAARLAQAGVRGDEEPLCGPWGFAELHLDGPPASPETALAGLGESLAIETDGLLVKRFPCCAAAHKTLDGIALLRERHAIDPASVVAVETVIPELGRRNLRFDEPTSDMQARFSLTYCATRVLWQGHLALADLTPAGVADPLIREWLPRVKIATERADLRRFAVPTRIITRDGRTFEVSIDALRGSLADPLSEADIRAKARDCCRWAGCEASWETVHALAAGLPAAEDCRPVLAGLAAAIAPAATRSEI